MVESCPAHCSWAKPRLTHVYALLIPGRAARPDVALRWLQEVLPTDAQRSRKPLQRHIVGLAAAFEAADRLLGFRPSGRRVPPARGPDLAARLGAQVAARLSRVPSRPEPPLPGSGANTQRAKAGPAIRSSANTHLAARFIIATLLSEPLLGDHDNSQPHRSRWGQGHLVAWLG